MARLYNCQTPLISRVRTAESSSTSRELVDGQIEFGNHRVRPAVNIGRESVGGALLWPQNPPRIPAVERFVWR